MYKHETNKPWKCDQCDFSHAAKQGLKAHVEIAHNKEAITDKVCHLCGWKTHNKENLKVHIKVQHENIKRYSCNVCDAQFYHNGKLKRHVRGKISLLFSDGK